MASWIYIFSRFTPEALLFEALIIFTLCAGYAAFWVLKKRRYGVLGAQGEAGAIKGYLNALILDAEQMRIQLFGLLAGQGTLEVYRPTQTAGATIMPVTAAATPIPAEALAAAAAAGSSPEVAAKVAALEAKMLEQAKATETLVNEKTRLEKELADARAKGGAAPAAGGAGVDPKLAEKIQLLEARLAEYSVIEDDLANLKRLQQENAALKAQLAAGGGAAAGATAAGAPAVAAAAAAPAAADPVAAAAAAMAETQTAAAPELDAVAAAEASLAAATPEAVAAAEPAAEAPALDAAAAATAGATADPAFEGLVDQVEQSLTPAADAAAAPAADAAPPAAAAAPEKSDADLVAEFEKMLNG